MAQPYATFSFLDHSGERAKMSVYVPDVTGGNLDNTKAGLLDLRAAIAALCLCSIGTTPELVSEVHTDVATLPASPYAQRERRAIFYCIDSVSGRKFDIGVPCPDMTDMALPGTDAINMADTEVAAYVTVLLAKAVSPEGNAFQVIKGKVIGVAN